MPPFPLHLPTIQNWNCHNCGGCCRQHAIFITPEEQKRIEDQKWTPADGIPASQAIFKEERTWTGKKRTQLAHQPDGACVFLDDKGLCRIHAKFGEPAKPLACRVYPYAFHPSGNGYTVSLRFSCPSVAGNKGTALVKQKQDLRRLAEEVVPPGEQRLPPPPITPRIRMEWEDTLQIVESLDHTLTEEAAPVALKLLRALFWTDLVAQSKFQKIRGERLQELLTLLVQASEIELPELPEASDENTSVSTLGAMQFRLLFGQYARKDTAANIDPSLRGRWKQLQNAMKLTLGGTTLPALHEGLAEIPVDVLKQIQVTLSPADEELFTRYFRVKLQGLHFCGPAYYGFPVIEGFHSLSLVYPVTVTIAQWLAASQSRAKTTHEDLLTALTIVDHQHGYSPAFGQWGARRRVKNLAATGDLQKLILRAK